MSQILSPESSTRELEGELELEELAEELEPGEEPVENFDLVYRKDMRKTSANQGSVYTPEGTGSDWYDEDEISEIEIQDVEIDVEQVKLNAVTGETVLVDSDGEETRYDVFSSFEGTTTFTQQVGENTYVFRYEKGDVEEEGKVRATEIGRSHEPVEWGGDELRKRVQLVDRIYHEARRNLWQNRKEEDEINAENSKFEQLKPVYNAVNNRIEQDGRAVINEKTHVGSARGAHIKRDFKKAVRRNPEGDSLDNYTIKNDGNEYPIIIEEA